MVGLLGINSPDIRFIGDPIADIIYGDHGCEHGMVGVIVFVHSIASYQEEVGKAVSIFTDEIEIRIGAEVGGIGLFHADDYGIQDV